MANAWADQLKVGDMVNAGDLGDARAEFDSSLPSAAWLEVIKAHPADDGFTDLTLRDEDGTLFGCDLPSAERVTIRR